MRSADKRTGIRRGIARMLPRVRPTADHAQVPTLMPDHGARPTWVGTCTGIELCTGPWRLCQPPLQSMADRTILATGCSASVRRRAAPRARR